MWNGTRLWSRRRPLPRRSWTPRSRPNAPLKPQSNPPGRSRIGRGRNRRRQAAIEASKAAVERAELDLGWTKVTSLVDGVAGIANVQMGNLVGPTIPIPLTSVSQVDPIKVYFPISEQEYLRAKHVSSSRAANGFIRQLTGADPGRRHGVSAQGQDSADRPASRHQHRHHSSRGGIPESRQYPAPGPVRARADPDQHEEKRAAGAAERSQRTSGRLPGRGCERRQQGEYSPGQSRARR